MIGLIVVLLLIGFIVDVGLYIVNRGGFIRFSVRSETLAGQVKNLAKKVDELTEKVKTLELNQKVNHSEEEGFSQKIDGLVTRVGILEESHVELDEEFTQFFNERTIPAIVTPEREPAKSNRGGRPRKAG